MSKNSYTLVKFLKFIGGTSLIGTVTLSSILVLSAFSMILTEASAQGGMPIGDFYCWKPNPQNVMTTNDVVLIDQFKIEYFFDEFTLEEFCESGQKTVIGDPNVVFPNRYPLGQHYTTYLVNSGVNPGVTFDVGIHNFINYDLRDVRVGPLKEIWIPNDKNVGQTELSEDKIRHYMCYEIISNHAVLGAQIILDTTNFEPATVNLNKPILFCNPAQKTHNGPPINTNFKNDEHHLTCFDFIGEPVVSPDVSALVGVVDQLVEDDPSVNELPMIDLEGDKACFQSTKIDLSLGGSLFPINNVSLMLAGAQMFGAWILPAIIASVGIAIVVARKY